MTFKTGERIFETSVTTGTGTYTLDGPQTGFQAFSTLGVNDCPYFATDDINWECGIGTYAATPDRLARTTVLGSSNAGAAVNWGAGTKKIRCGPLAAFAVPRTLSKSVAGSSDVALTQDEQRRDQLVLTGLLTGNINVTVDVSPWRWSVYNNTTGSFTLKVKTTAGTGIFVPQGSRMVLECDGTNVVEAIPVATQAQQEAGTNTAAIVTPAVQQYHASAAKFWAYVTTGTATPTLSASYNVTSITDDGTGLLTVTIGTDFSSVTWTPFGSCRDAAGEGASVGWGPPAAGSIQFRATDNASTLADPEAWGVGGFGDQ